MCAYWEEQVYFGTAVSGLFWGVVLFPRLFVGGSWTWTAWTGIDFKLARGFFSLVGHR